MQINEIQRREAEPFEFVFEVGHPFTNEWRRFAIHRFGHQHVLLDRYGVLEHPVNHNHVESHELLALPYGLPRDLADVRDKLHAKPPSLDATGTATHVQRDHPILFRMERCMH